MPQSEITIVKTVAPTHFQKQMGRGTWLGVWWLFFACLEMISSRVIVPTLPPQYFSILLRRISEYFSILLNPPQDFSILLSSTFEYFSNSLHNLQASLLISKRKKTA